MLRLKREKSIVICRGGCGWPVRYAGTVEQNLDVLSVHDAVVWPAGGLPLRPLTNDTPNPSLRRVPPILDQSRGDSRRRYLRLLCFP
jgi:hypothetical protein